MSKPKNAETAAPAAVPCTNDAACACASFLGRGAPADWRAAENEEIRSELAAAAAGRIGADPFAHARRPAWQCTLEFGLRCLIQLDRAGQLAAEERVRLANRANVLLRAHSPSVPLEVHLDAVEAGRAEITGARKNEVL